jgi:hypothetical protein
MAEQRVSVSPAEVQNYLGGIDYPASRQDLIDHAKKHSAPDEVIRLLTAISDQQYATPADVNKAVGEVE